MYYKTENFLIKYYSSYNVFVIKNRIGLKDCVIYNEEEFKKLNPIKIKKSTFDFLINKYYRETKDKWVFEGVEYTKINNFSNEDWFKKVPRHKKTSSGYFDHLDKDIYFIVYHLGKVYYCLPCYNGYDRSILYDFKTKQQVKWTSLKNCQPILNLKTNKII